MENNIEIILHQFCQLQLEASAKEIPASDLMEDLFLAEDKICEYFSLPSNSINSLKLADDILNYSNDKDEYIFELNKRIKDYSKYYLSSSPLTNTEILRKFKDKIYTSFVCKELKVDFHLYTSFLFAELYCSDQISEDEFLNEVQIIQENPMLLNRLALLIFTKNKVETIELIEELEKYGLQFVFIYLEFYHDLNLK